MLEIRIHTRHSDDLFDEPFHPFRRYTWGAIGAAAVSSAVSIGASALNKSSAPATAQYVPVNPTQVQNNAIQGDLSSLSDATTLADQSTNSTAAAALASRNITQPGYSNLSSALTSDATSLADNPYQIPQSVVDQLSQYAAENNISEGTGNASGFSQDNLLRSLGINALQYGQSNLSAATSALSTLTGTAPNVSPVSPLSFMLTPSQALQTQTQNNQEQQQIQQGANNAAAAANNQNSSNLWDAVSSQGGNLGSILSSYLSGGTSGSTGSALSFNSPSIASAVGPLTATGQ